MFNLLIRLFGLHNNYLDTRPVEYPTPSFPTPSPSPSVMGPPPTNPILETLQPVKSWCHPFKDKSHPLLQLTTMAKAIAGYYPIGRNGLWHGGVHFDSGTASVLDQSSVHCLADGEVIAYRIDERSAATSYFHEGVAVERPFSRNFVLVRHCLQPPRIEGSADAPPTLIFYSLYMHLQDWAVYRDAPDLSRPSFWPLGATYRVAPTASDVRLGQPEQKGLNVRNQSRQGRVIGFLPRGAQVTVSGTGDYRRLENAPGPEHLKAADGSLRGYLSVSFLEPIAAGQYRVISEDKLNLREEASSHSAVIAQLEPGTEVTISGEGDFRKLEHINQYIHFNSLLAAQEPQGVERIVVLDTPKAIKAADLIGHIGLYQDQAESEPGKKLHLEVFTDESVEAFIQASRMWAQRLPASEKTWIKFEKGTPVVPHQDNYRATQYPIPLTDGPVSGSDLLLPKSLLDGLPAERKIAVPRNNLDKSYNWYRLDGLLNDADNNLLDGWVREEVGVTPWVSPWSWEGYDILLDYDTPLNALASFFRDLGKLDEAQLERYQRMADISVQGRVKSRLYDIIDSDRDGKMTAAEVQAAISLPAHAQSISQMIIYSQSEWYKPGKWDGLDEILGHSGSTPHTNWLAEKERIKALCWWEELAEKVGLPTHGRVFHIHPVGLVGCFSSTHPLEITRAQLQQIFPRADETDIDIVLGEINSRLVEFKLDTRLRQRHFFAQIRGEVGDSMKGVSESWEYSAEALKSFSVYYRAHPSEAETDGYLRDSAGRITRRANQVEIGRKHFQRLNGNRVTHPDDGYNFRGRGLIQITGYEKYHGYTRDYNKYWVGEAPDAVSSPELINFGANAIRSALWFWLFKAPYTAELGQGLSDVPGVTRIVNGGVTGLAERESAYILVEGVLK